MKSIASMLLIIALGFGLAGCPGGGGGGGGSSSAFAVSTTSADFGVVDNAYTSTLATTGGTAPFSWTLFGGALPVGLSLNATTGVVSGTPTVAGNSTADFIVTDSTGQTANGSVLFAVHPRTDRASVNSNGVAGSGASSSPSISGDGSLVAFASSSSNFVPGVGGTQIYVHNRQTNQIEVISRDNDTAVVNEGGAASSDPAISADRRYVAFVSQATNLLAPAPAVPAGQQIYVRDRQTGVTSLVSVDNTGASIPGDGISSGPSISGDGRYVAFVSQATNLLAPAPAVPAGQQIYVRDRQTGVTSLVSVDNTGASIPGDGISSGPSISGDGRYVAFVSVATNLLAPDPVVLGGQQIYVRDRQLGLSSLASQDNTNTNIEGAGGISDTPSMNSDGRFVAFFSQATNLVSGSGAHIYVRALP
ncbi:MAG: PD40 domain-containing protein [Nitrospirae bacterium]|nr:PD40 domain-containing protein [Nitrospirota bacterium]